MSVDVSFSSGIAFASPAAALQPAITTAIGFASAFGTPSIFGTLVTGVSFRSAFALHTGYLATGRYRR